jgi:hypothetical protein
VLTAVQLLWGGSLGVCAPEEGYPGPGYSNLVGNISGAEASLKMLMSSVADTITAERHATPR